MKKKWTKSSGFTLAELLIVVAIIAVLVAISIPIFTSQLEKAREATDLSDVRSAYAEVMMAAISDDTTATYSKDPNQTIHKSNGLYSVTVSPLHQEQDNWQGNMDLNVGGVSSKDTTHWIGTPKAAGSCEVSYNPQGDSVVLNWSGKSTGGGNTGGSGTITPGGGTTGGGSTPAPNPGTGGGTTGGTTGGGSTSAPNPGTGGGTSGGTAGGDNNQGNSGTGDNTGNGNNNQGNTGGNTGGSTGGSETPSTDKNEPSDLPTPGTIDDLLSRITSVPYPDTAFTGILGNIYSYNGKLYVCTHNQYFAAGGSPDHDTGNFQAQFREISKDNTILTIDDSINGQLPTMEDGNIYYDGQDFYMCAYGYNYFYIPNENTIKTSTNPSGYWIKINFIPITDYPQ